MGMVLRMYAARDTNDMVSKPQSPINGVKLITGKAGFSSYAGTANYSL